MISKIKVVPAENGDGLRVEAHDGDGTVTQKTMTDEKFALLFAAQLAEFFDAILEVDPLTGANGDFLTAVDAQ